jgi:ribose transport system substrate-binding protein
LNAKKLKGKRILVVVDDMSIPILAETADAAQSAGRLAGLQVTIVDGASDTSKIVQAVQEGIRTSNAELLIAIPAGLIPNELAQAKKAHIPIISCLDEQPVAGTTGQGAGPGYFGNISTNPILAGELIADSVIVATNGKAQVAIFSSTGADPSAYVDQGIRTEMGKCRALGCRVLTDVGTPGADWSSELAPRTAAVILRYPTLNYILPVFDGMTIFVAPAVQQSGVKTVHVVTFNASSAVLQDIQQGTIVTADPGQDNTWIGWASIDQAMRGILGLKPANPVQPVRYFDKSNLRGITVTNESKLFGSPAFRQGFMKLWGLG